MARIWTCQRQTKGVKCGHVNPKIKHLCQGCGKRRPPTKRPAHMAALEIPYETYIIINGGEHCGICGAGPANGKRLNRDHDHGTGLPRGLLCPWCNQRLGHRYTADWFRAAARYLSRRLDLS